MQVILRGFNEAGNTWRVLSRGVIGSDMFLKHHLIALCKIDRRKMWDLIRRRENGEKWSDSGSILKVEPSGLVIDRIEVVKKDEVLV